jgi:DNA-binding response OmpR family regulator
MLATRGEVANVTRALDSGADDYLTKSFSPLVLLARAQACATPEPYKNLESIVLSGR